MHKTRSKSLEEITLVSRFRNLVRSSPNIALGETVACATCVVARRANIVGFCWLAQLTLNLGQDPLSQQMVLLPGLGPA